MRARRRLRIVAELAIAGLSVGAVAAVWIWGTELEVMDRWSPDWIDHQPSANATVVELPYVLLVADEHCGGRVRREVLIGHFGPPDNPCLRLLPGETSYSYGSLSDLPGGLVLWHATRNNGPYSYWITRRPPA